MIVNFIKKNGIYFGKKECKMKELGIVVSCILVFIIFTFTFISLPKPQIYRTSDYIQQKQLDQLEQINENLKEIKELEGRIIDRIK